MLNEYSSVKRLLDETNNRLCEVEPGLFKLGKPLDTDIILEKLQTAHMLLRVVYCDLSGRIEEDN